MIDVMGFRTRLWLLASPLLGLAPRVRAQPNTNTPSGGPGREQGEVQVGAGTQGDVTTGSSGPQKKKGGDSKGAEAKGDPKSGDPNTGNAAPAAGSDTGPAAVNGKRPQGGQ